MAEEAPLPFRLHRKKKFIVRRVEKVIDSLYRRESNLDLRGLRLNQLREDTSPDHFEIDWKRREDVEENNRWAHGRRERYLLIVTETIRAINIA